jgi:hypothetical protein
MNSCAQMPSSIVRQALCFLTMRMQPKADPQAILPRVHGYHEDSNFSAQITMQTKWIVFLAESALSASGFCALGSDACLASGDWQTALCIVDPLVLVLSFSRSVGNFQACRLLVAVIAKRIGCVGCVEISACLS